MRPRRAVLVLPSLADPAHRRVARSLAPRLRRLGVETSVFAPSAGECPGRTRRRLEALLLGKPASACHVMFFSRGLGWLMPARLPPETPVVLTHQGASLEYLEHPRVFRSLARRADAVTSVSKAGLRELVRDMPWIRPKAAVIPNGTDLPEEGAAADAEPPRRKRGAYILTVGRLAAYKGTDILLVAFADLLGRGLDLDLVAAGPDQTGGAAARFAGRLGVARRVRLLGPRSPAEVRRLLAGCLFFVLPSRRENMPMALLEAMAAGKPVAAARAGGAAEAVRHGVDGLLVPAGDARALAAAMERLAQDGGLRERLGRAAAARARSFAWERIAGMYRRLYSSLP